MISASRLLARVNRRSWLRTAAAAGISGATLSLPRLASASVPVEPDFRIQHGRVRQTIMGWTFDPMPTLELARHCKAIGLVAMEGIDEKHYPAIRELGLAVSLVGSHGFTKGPFN